jgi:hypothetical protein
LQGSKVAGLQGCRVAKLQGGNLATLQLCSLAFSRQLYMRAHTHNERKFFAPLHLCAFALRHFENSCKVAKLQGVNVAALQPCIFASVGNQADMIVGWIV